MLWNSKKLGLQEQFPNHVELWKCRCHNPLRKTTRRGLLNKSDSDGLILLISSLSEQLYPRLRQLMSTNEPELQKLKRWKILKERFADLVEERLNIRRGAVQKLLIPENINLTYKEFLQILSLSAGSGGYERLKASLFDFKP